MLQHSPGDLIRITKKGRYNGDLAVVISQRPSDVWLTVACVPREKPLGKRKRSGAKSAARLFVAEDFTRAHFKVLAEGRDGFVKIGDRGFKHGLEYMVLSAYEIVEDPAPPAAQIFLLWEIPEFEDIMMTALNRAFKRSWNSGSRVHAIHGDLAGADGVLISSNGQNAQVQLDGLATAVSYPLDDLERRFRCGDEVNVGAGAHAGKRGVILSFDNGTGYACMALIAPVDDSGEIVSSSEY